MITTVLFDLDGTLLPVNEEKFVYLYISKLGETFSNAGYDKDKFIKALWLGTKAMINNNGLHTNESVFWDTFHEMVHEDHTKVITMFEKFYMTDFDFVKASTWESAYAYKCIELLKQKGLTIALATNPLFPKIATYKRVGWAGLNINDFKLITTYENSSFAKPNLSYYESILKALDVLPENCLMIGNDALEDMAISKLNANTYLLTDCLNNKTKVDISKYNHGSFEDLYQFLLKLDQVGE